MNLFHETESKYYELLSYMINDKEAYSAKEVAEYTEKYLIGETDYDVIEELFLSKEDSETVFSLIGLIQVIVVIVFVLRECLKGSRMRWHH